MQPPLDEVEVTLRWYEHRYTLGETAQEFYNGCTSCFHIPNEGGCQGRHGRLVL